ncbi:ligase-associated DNA damage response endonuclease PdeM [Persicimonas caeni]|uniref:Ligase-associated DNA damage response endonuclease PdeM n=1 Tax=Persicimonas caeni TaxID=2292766 RepID=A0A4Y6PMP8_PERCE|nr:ligase-associated DNA damage response endonuclease PdeM [Persicimonas caeni]QDG49530.1 ligase-associated DNA damage response endonuclease PdeM [Persicimonas caeni]QED30751.1 ligase-associated DNA damage response endonuclease PdeM [Persicimonas caeni]
MDASRLDIDLAGERLVLMGERAIWWPERRTLLVADVHLGKEETFRRQGVPLPRGGLDETLDRLTACVGATDAERLVVLGDLVHARSGLTDEVVANVGDWLDGLGAELVLVRGNHDRHLTDATSSWQMEVVDEVLVEGPFVLAHEPVEDGHGYVLAGHLHPTVRLRAGGDTLRLACFCFDEKVGMLPAFTPFSNGPVHKKAAGRRLFAVADGEVFGL